MKLPGYYTSGQFAKMAKISVRTVRFYDKQNILKPSFVSASGIRYYTDQDFVRLQQILLLKYLGFSLDEIRSMTVDNSDPRFLLDSLQLQQKLVRDRIAQLQLVEKAIEDTAEEIRSHHNIDWEHMLNLIHLTNMKQTMKIQYQNAGNISARIRLHSLFSANKQGWFPWLYEQYQIHNGMEILELGCGDGALWYENLSLLPSDLSITLSDISDGMLSDAKRKIGSDDPRFSFQRFDCQDIPFDSNLFDLVIANHVLFYPEDLSRTFSEILRVLKPGGKLVCSAYSSRHMQEISRLVQEFDGRIVLSADGLYEIFGMENGKALLDPWFEGVTWHLYQDHLLITSPDPLIQYIQSCHGNQNQYILEKHKDFLSFVSHKTQKGFYVTKEAGYFSCQKPADPA